MESSLEYIVKDAVLKVFGEPFKEVPKRKYLCTKCNLEVSSSKELHPHHVTYVPSTVRPICVTCHRRITYLNAMKARELKRKLSTEERLEVWGKFLQEETSIDELEKSLKWYKWFETQKGFMC